MPLSWQDCFSRVPGLTWNEDGTLCPEKPLTSLKRLRKFLDRVHVHQCLLKPFFGKKNYPLVDSRDLQPSFEPELFEYTELPGFSLVALERPLNYFNEIFVYVKLTSRREPSDFATGSACLLKRNIHAANVRTFLNRLPKTLQEKFVQDTDEMNVSALESYPILLKYLLHMDRAHVMACDAAGIFHLSGIYASFPSDLDTELKRFGLKIRKFKPNDNLAYEQHRIFVYQFLMELYGYPIVSERKTSAALFARKLFRLGEPFLIKALGQSDRIITSLYRHPENRMYPRVEKTALVRVETDNRETLTFLKEGGFLLHPKKKAVILRVTYRQHKFDPNNVRQDRALSIQSQEIIHPITGEICPQVNLLKDTYLMTLRLNDIVRGEYEGQVRYKRHEIVEDTDTHEKRLKFLYSWLSKHQRRIIGYSDEFYAGVTKVLKNYLFGEGSEDRFQDLHELHQEVAGSFSYIVQARKVRKLEEISDRKDKGKHLTFQETLREAAKIISEIKFESVNYFDTLANHAIYTGERILNNRYLIRRYIQPRETELTPRGVGIRKAYGRLVSLLDELKAIRKSRAYTGEEEKQPSSPTSAAKG